MRFSNFRINFRLLTRKRVKNDARPGARQKLNFASNIKINDTTTAGNKYDDDTAQRTKKRTQI